jgi:hypothetical protein
MRKLLLLTALALVPAPPDATEGARTFDTGNTLLESCKESNPSPGGYQCVGVIAGATDMLQYWQALRRPRWRVCMTDAVTEVQARDVVVRFLLVHPERRHYGAAELIGQALADAFPCPH